MFPLRTLEAMRCSLSASPWSTIYRVMVPLPLMGGSQESRTDTISGVATREVTSLGPAGRGRGKGTR